MSGPDEAEDGTTQFVLDNPTEAAAELEQLRAVKIAALRVICLRPQIETRPLRDSFADDAAGLHAFNLAVMLWGDKAIARHIPPLDHLDHALRQVGGAAS